MSSTLETAVLIVPPFEVQAFAAPLRRKAMPDHWMHVPAHLTLLYPFAPLADVDDMLPRLRQALSSLSPFSVTLDRYGRFPTALVLEPADPQPLFDLHRLLAATFPEYPIYGGEFGHELRPHLTLAHSEDGTVLDDLVLPPAPVLTFRVDRLWVYAGDSKAAVPFVPLAIAGFGPAR